MSRILRTAYVAAGIALAIAAGTASAGFTALDSTRGVGNQSFSGALGMDFDVLSSIVVTELGAFDSNQDGIMGGPIAVGIFNRNTGLLVGSAASIDTADTLDGESRFEDIADIVLGVGEYSIVAIGYSGAEQNGNTHGSTGGPTINTGGGLIDFVGDSRFLSTATLVFPTIVDGGPANRYDAGTFKFEDLKNIAVPAPGAVVLMLLGVGLITRRFRTA